MKEGDKDSVMYKKLDLIVSFEDCASNHIVGIRDPYTGIMIETQLEWTFMSSKVRLIFR